MSLLTFEKHQKPSISSIPSGTGFKEIPLDLASPAIKVRQRKSRQSRTRAAVDGDEDVDESDNSEDGGR